MKIKNDALLQAENFIRVGQTSLAQELAQSLLPKVKSLNAIEKIKLGNILRRTSNFTEATRLLHKFARSEKTPKDIRDSAILEYGTALLFLGVIEEGMEILQKLDVNHYPSVLVNMALGYQQEWDYTAAVPLLEKFVSSKNIDSYQRLVGEVNLQISYLSADFSKLTWDRVQELGKEISSQNLTLLSGVFTQIEGRFLSSQKRYDEARTIFQKGLSKLQNVATFDRLRLQKWLLINEFERDPQQKKLLAQLLELKAQSQQLNDSETLRECDRYIGQFESHSELFNYCYHGTPYPAYRLYFPINQVQPTWSLSLDSDGKQIITNESQESLAIDMLDEPLIRTTKKTLTTGSCMQLLLTALTLDFYRPMTLPRFFRYAYPGQHWNPATSPIQVRQGLFRLRHWLQKSGYNLKVHENNSKYFLAAKNNTQPILIGPNKFSFDQKISHILKKEFGDRNFSFEEFRKLSDHSLRTMQRVLSDLLQKKILIKEGETRATRFKVNNIS